MITKSILDSQEYEFLRTNKHLKGKIILLGLSGSYSYGTNNDNSDIDIRGVALNQKSDLIGMTSFEQYVDDRTDTCIYGFNKMITLLTNCNPNVIELLGLNRENYLCLNPIGQALLDNKKLFLSKRAAQSFGGYASAQLRRLQNALARDAYAQEEKQKHICNSVQNAMLHFAERNEKLEEGSLRIYIDQSNRPEFNTEIYLDADLKHYPLRDYRNIWAEINNIVKAYDKIGKRNKKKDEDHLNKHAMHLIRLFMMAIDILEKEEINTFRKEEQDVLIDIRNGLFQKPEGDFSKEFYELLAEYEGKLKAAEMHTNLPDEPDFAGIQDFVMGVNERVVRGEV